MRLLRYGRELILRCFASQGVLHSVTPPSHFFNPKQERLRARGHTALTCTGISISTCPSAATFIMRLSLLQCTAAGSKELKLVLESYPI